MLVNCVSKGGNLLVNVGPDARGVIPEVSVHILQEVGQWLRHNGDSIYNSGVAQLKKPEWGRYTQKGKILYAHVMETVLGHICLPGLNGKVKKARLLKNGAEVILTGFWNAEVDTLDDPEDIFMNFGYPVHHTFTQPDEIDTVVELELV